MISSCCLHTVFPNILCFCHFNSKHWTIFWTNWTIYCIAIWPYNYPYICELGTERVISNSRACEKGYIHIRLDGADRNRAFHHQKCPPNLFGSGPRRTMVSGMFLDWFTQSNYRTYSMWVQNGMLRTMLISIICTQVHCILFLWRKLWN